MRHLGALLAEVPELLVELDVTLTRQDRLGEPAAGGRSDEQPLPYSVAASDAHDLLRLTVTAWAAVYGTRTNSPVLAASFLGRHVEAIRSTTEGPQVLDELAHAVQHAREAVDRHEELLWFGVCAAIVPIPGNGGIPCAGDLFGHRDDLLVRCRRCGASHDAQARRSRILDVALDRDLPATDLARLTTAYGLRVSGSVVRNLAARGRLIPVGLTADGRPTYRVGDLLDRLTDRRTA